MALSGSASNGRNIDLFNNNNFLRPIIYQKLRKADQLITAEKTGVEGEGTFETKLAVASAPVWRPMKTWPKTVCRWDLTIGQNVKCLDRDGQTRSEQYLNAWKIIFKNTITTIKAWTILIEECKLLPDRDRVGL